MSSFKPGDWIQCTYANGTKFVAQAVSETSVKEAGRVYPTTLDSDWVAWQPKVGEWCWFWNKCMDIDQSPRLAQFHLIVKELQKPMDFPAFYQIKYKATKLGYLYDFCEPFIGQLPTHLLRINHE